MAILADQWELKLKVTFGESVDHADAVRRVRALVGDGDIICVEVREATALEDDQIAVLTQA